MYILDLKGYLKGRAMRLGVGREMCVCEDLVVRDEGRYDAHTVYAFWKLPSVTLVHSVALS